MNNEELGALLEEAPKNLNIQKTFMTARAKMDRHFRAVCSVSGGSDSDIMIDVLERVKSRCDITYAFYNTGMEYAATKRHLDDLEGQYGITIERVDAVVPAPLGCKKHGQPFLSKQTSEFISRLQKHGFKWEDRPFGELYAEYPKCKAALRYWCNEWPEGSTANISRNKYLKEFMVENPPWFAISPYCCEGAKKHTAKMINRIYKPDLVVAGTRRAENGARSTAYSTCFTPADDTGVAEYRPLFFWTDADKLAYKGHYGITYSDAYEVYGLPRTGCACCPFGSRFERELELAAKYEPNLYVAAANVFADSYRYTRMYRAFKDRKKAEGKEDKR